MCFLESGIAIDVPDGQSGSWRIQSFSVTEAQSQTTALRAALNPGRDLFVPPGDYKRLTYRGEVIMSNTPMEIRTHSPILLRASGHILLNGLGLGMVLKGLLESEDVQSVTVIELSEDVIRLTAPTFADDPRVTIVHDDAYRFEPPEGMRYQAVWHDIWATISSDNLSEMDALERRYQPFSDWQGCWARSECESRHH